MSELNLILNLDGENKSMSINNKSSIKDFFFQTRNIFSSISQNIYKYKLIFFNGIPPKKIREIDTDENKTLEDMKVYNNSMIRILIDEENPIPDILPINFKSDLSSENEKIIDNNSKIFL